MRGRDFLEVVRFLEPLDTEAGLRAQIGRLYYAAYLEARSWCEEYLGFQRERFGREHAEVAKLLTLIAPAISEDLAFLRSLRNTADYDLHISVATLMLEREDARKRSARVISGIDGLAPPGSDS